MLNAIPVTRSADDLVSSDPEDDFEPRSDKIPNESINLGERRKSSLYSVKSESTSSVEVPKRNATVDMGIKNFF